MSEQRTAIVAVGFVLIAFLCAAVAVAAFASGSPEAETGPDPWVNLGRGVYYRTFTDGGHTFVVTRQNSAGAIALVQVIP